MTEEELEAIIEKARIDRAYRLDLNGKQLTTLPDSIGSLNYLILIKQVGYEKICTQLNALDLDNWREYTLLRIDVIERYYASEEPMVLLKMTCPSTGHIHILRVPPEMTSAETAITWVNHGIHPDKFAVQT